MRVLVIEDDPYAAESTEALLRAAGIVCEVTDLGEDGIGTTGDHGEGDGIPTPGEPNVAPVAVGSDVAGANLIVHVSDCWTFFRVNENWAIESPASRVRLTSARTWIRTCRSSAGTERPSR